MSPRKTRPDPNISDPLSETTVQRRIWASYLAAKYTRFSFAAALNVPYSTVDNWDKGTSIPSLPLLVRVAELLEVPIQHLIYGHRGGPGDGREVVLTQTAVMELLAEAGATKEARAAYAAHETSDAGRYQERTRSYIIAWLSAYEAARKNSASHDEAADEAVTQAVAARMISGAIASGGRTLQRDELRAVLKKPPTREEMKSDPSLSPLKKAPKRKSSKAPRPRKH